MTPRFGEVWIVGTDPDDILPHQPYLIVSSDLYNEAGGGVICCEIDLHGRGRPIVRESLGDLGEAVLDRVAWFPPGFLRERMAEGLPAGRHGEVARKIRALIGN